MGELSIKDTAPQLADPTELQNTISCGDSAIVLSKLADETVDLVLTSPPYDHARDNKDYSPIFDFEAIAQQIARILKRGGILVWNVNDMVGKNGGKSGTSYKQLLYFIEECGLIHHDTIFLLKSSFSFPGSGKRYHNVVEPAYILSKGRPDHVNLLKDRKNKTKVSGGPSGRNKDGTRRTRQGRKENTEFGIRFNTWGPYNIGGGHSTKDKIDHPALMPEAMARDLILSYSNVGDLVLDCFGGGGTTGIIAHENKRAFHLIEISKDYCKKIKKRFKERFQWDVSIS